MEEKQIAVIVEKKQELMNACVELLGFASDISDQANKFNIDDESSLNYVPSLTTLMATISTVKDCVSFAKKTMDAVGVFEGIFNNVCGLK